MNESQLKMICKFHYHEGNLAIAKAVEKSVRLEILSHLINFSSKHLVNEIELELTRLLNENA